MFTKGKKIIRDVRQIRRNRNFTAAQCHALLFSYLKVFWLSLLHGRVTKITTMSLFGHQLQVRNMTEFVNLFDEVIVSDFYRTKLTRTPEVIFDAGANVGMSAIYFRWLYPKAKLVCFEPDPDTYAALKKNLGEGNDQLTLHNVALSDTVGTIPFYRRHDLSIASTTSSVNADKSERIDVPTKPLSAFVDGKIDVLKMDIERMETKVFKELLSSDAIKQIETFAMEYHYDFSDVDNKLSELLTVFEQAGLVYVITLLNDKLPEYKTYRIEGWRPTTT